MVLSNEQQRVHHLLTEAIKVLCKSGLTYTNGFSVEGLLGITVHDTDQVFLVSIKEKIFGSKESQKDYMPGGRPKDSTVTSDPAAMNDLALIENAEQLPEHQDESHQQVQNDAVTMDTQLQAKSLSPTPKRRGRRKRKPKSYKVDAPLEVWETPDKGAHVNAAASDDPSIVENSDGLQPNDSQFQATPTEFGSTVKNEYSIEADGSEEGTYGNKEEDFMNVSIKSEPLSGEESNSNDEFPDMRNPLAFCGPLPEGGIPWPDFPGASMAAMSNPALAQDPLWLMAMRNSPGKASSWAKLREETVKRRQYRHRMKLLNPGKWEETKLRDAQRKRQIRETWTEEKKEAERQKGRERKRTQRQIMKVQAAAEMEAASHLLQNSIGVPGVGALPGSIGVPGVGALPGLPGVPGVAPGLVAAVPAVGDLTSPTGPGITPTSLLGSAVPTAATLTTGLPGALPAALPGMFGLVPSPNPAMAAAMAAAANKLAASMSSQHQVANQEQAEATKDDAGGDVTTEPEPDESHGSWQPELQIQDVQSVSTEWAAPDENQTHVIAPIEDPEYNQ